MKTKVYCGWREDLKGRTALVARDGVERVLVQFNPVIIPDDAGDTYYLPFEPVRIEGNRAYDNLCFGWHDFPANQFIDEETGD